jgi:hypothetical protein
VLSFKKNVKNGYNTTPTLTQDNAFWLTTHHYDDNDELVLPNFRQEGREGGTQGLRTA